MSEKNSLELMMLSTYELVVESSVGSASAVLYLDSNLGAHFPRPQHIALLGHFSRSCLEHFTTRQWS